MYFPSLYSLSFGIFPAEYRIIDAIASKDKKDGLIIP
jgi:hypothetical protein